MTESDVIIDILTEATLSIMGKEEDNPILSRLGISATQARLMNIGLLHDEGGQNVAKLSEMVEKAGLPPSLLRSLSKDSILIPAQTDKGKGFFILYQRNAKGRIFSLDFPELFGNYKLWIPENGTVSEAVQKEEGVPSIVYICTNPADALAFIGSGAMAVYDPRKRDPAGELVPLISELKEYQEIRKEIGDPIEYLISRDNCQTPADNEDLETDYLKVGAVLSQIGAQDWKDFEREATDAEHMRRKSSAGENPYTNPYEMVGLPNDFFRNGIISDAQAQQEKKNEAVLRMIEQRRIVANTSIRADFENGVYDDALRERAKREPIKTGLRKLDECLNGGLYTGLYIVGGTPSAGKTTFLTGLLAEAEYQGHNVFFISLEQAKEEIEDRVISRASFMSTYKYRGKLAETGDLSQALTLSDLKHTPTWINNPSDERYNLLQQAKYSYAAPKPRYGNATPGNSFILDSREKLREWAQGTGITLSQPEIDPNDPMAKYGIASKVSIGDLADLIRAYERVYSPLGDTPEEMRLKHPIIVIDYLQIMAPEDPEAKETRANIDLTIAGLKQIVKSHDITLLCISSLARHGYAKEGGKKKASPDMNDFKNSGNIEYTADVLITLSDAPGAKRSKEDRAVYLKILKNRDGPADVYRGLRYYASVATFSDTQVLKGEGHGPTPADGDGEIDEDGRDSQDMEFYPDE